MITKQYRLIGTTPLLMHNGALANPLNRYVRELNTLQKKGRGLKDEAAIWEIAELEFLGGLYTDGNGTIGIPASIVFTVIRNGARKFNKGKTIEAGLIVSEFFPLEYDGPSDPRELFHYTNENDERPFVDMRMVGVRRNKVLRTRPYFEEWELPITVGIDETIVEPTDMLAYIDAAGVQCGIGDARSLGFGRFVVEEV